MESKGKYMAACEAHGLIEKSLERLDNTQAELYTLDRERAQQVAAMQSDITEIKTEQKVLRKDITELKTDFTEVKNNVSSLNQKVGKMEANQQQMNTSITELTKAINSKKWQPKDYTVIIVAILSLAGTIATAFLKS